MNLQIFIIPIACGVIGYFTNLIAIKMLFRPHKAKKIFGMNVPFTPGVLPRRKAALAKQMGKSVKENLLTGDAIKEQILSADIDTKIEEILDDIYIKLCTENKSLGMYLEEILGSRRETLVEDVIWQAKELLKSHLNEEGLKRSISLLLKDKIMEIVDGEQVKEYIVKNKDVIVEQVKSVVSKKIDEMKEEGTTLKEVVPEKYVIDMKKMVLENAPYLTDFIQKELKENENLDNKFKDLIKRTMDDKLGKLVGGLFYNKAYENIKEGVIDYLDEEENKAKVVEKIWSMIDAVLSKEVNFLIEKTKGVKIKEESIGYIAKKFEENKDALFDEMVKRIRPNVEEEIFKYVYIAIDEFVNEEIDTIVKNHESGIKNYIRNINVSAIIRGLGKKNFEILKKYIIMRSKLALKVGADYIVDELDIEGIVEEKINNFEEDELEGLILSIAKRELKYITLMGGVLGFILGFLLEIPRMF